MNTRKSNDNLSLNSYMTILQEYARAAAAVLGNYEYYT